MQPESNDPEPQPRIDGPPTVLALRDAWKGFGGRPAIAGIDLDLHAGEAVALIGDNGAGKTTLIKLLSGALEPDAGEILVDGAPAHFARPRDAMAAGIATAYQDLALCGNLDATANLFLGDEPRRAVLGPLLSIVDHRAMRREATRIFRDFGIDVPVRGTRVRNLSGGQRQAIAVARALRADARVLLLDEPTASLGVAQTETVLRLARHFCDRGGAVLFVSHDVEEVLQLADRIVLLRNGRVAAEWNPRDVDRDVLADAIGVHEEIAVGPR